LIEGHLERKKGEGTNTNIERTAERLRFVCG